MKRKSFSSLFSIKILGIILTIILGFFSLNIKSAEASILIDIKLDGKSTKILITPEGDYWEVTGYVITGFEPFRVKANEETFWNKAVIHQPYTVEKIEATENQKIQEVKEAIDARLILHKKEIRDSEISEITKLEARINNIEDRSYPEAQKYLLNISNIAKTFSNSYDAIYEKMKNHDDEYNVYQEKSIENVIEKIRKIYIYIEVLQP